MWIRFKQTYRKIRNQQHSLLKCQKFRSLPVEKRHGNVQQYQLCRLCLQHGHQINQCLSRQQCFKCNARLCFTGKKVQEIQIQILNRILIISRQIIKGLIVIIPIPLTNYCWLLAVFHTSHPKMSNHILPQVRERFYLVQRWLGFSNLIGNTYGNIQPFLSAKLDYNSYQKSYWNEPTSYYD